MLCPKCNNAIYIGSRLAEDAYEEIGQNESGNEVFQHYKCPPYLHTLQCVECYEDFFTHNLTDRYCSTYCQEKKYEDF